MKLARWLETLDPPLQHTVERLPDYSPPPDWLVIISRPSLYNSPPPVRKVLTQEKEPTLVGALEQLRREAIEQPQRFKDLAHLLGIRKYKELIHYVDIE